MYGECVNGDSQVFCVDLRKALAPRIVSENGIENVNESMTVELIV